MSASCASTILVSAAQECQAPGKWMQERTSICTKRASLKLHITFNRLPQWGTAAELQLEVPYENSILKCHRGLIKTGTAAPGEQGLQPSCFPDLKQLWVVFFCSLERVHMQAFSLCTVPNMTNNAPPTISGQENSTGEQEDLLLPHHAVVLLQIGPLQHFSKNWIPTGNSQLPHGCKSLQQSHVKCNVQFGSLVATSCHC